MTAPFDKPYGDNILIPPLGPIPDRSELLRWLTRTPDTTENIADIPKYVRLHHLLNLRDLHIPNTEGQRVAQTIDLLLRQGYKARDPESPNTWGQISNENRFYSPVKPSPLGAVVVGHSGVGKTQTIRRCLARYPQIYRHESFPQLLGAHYQACWLSVEIPASGKAEDLVRALMAAWDNMLTDCLGTENHRFKDALAKQKLNPDKGFYEWSQVAKGHVLGLLHLDEAQNLFKLPSLKDRRSRGNGENPELSIVEDQTIRFILQILNDWGIPTIVSGTPDGIGALMRRFSNEQRFTSGGYHKLAPFTGIDDPEFKDLFFPTLLRNQWLKTPLGDDDELRKLVIDSTAGIPRLIVALWISAQRIALERSDLDELQLTDFKRAVDGPLAPVKPAIKALLTGEPSLLSRYEDLIRLDDGFWEQFWVSS